MKFNLLAEQQGNTKINVSVELTTDELANTLRHNKEVLEFLFDNTYTIKDIIKSIVKAYEDISKINKENYDDVEDKPMDNFFNIDKIIKEVK